MRLDDVVILDVFHDIEPLSFRILSAKAKALLFQSGVAGKDSIHVPHSDGDVDDGFGFYAGDGGASDRLERNDFVFEDFPKLVDESLSISVSFLL